MQNRPNFFIIGAPKSGTTTIYDLLGQHPEIYLSPVKEPAFFCEGENWARGFEWYESLFVGVKSESIIGEGSTYYTQRPLFENVASKIAAYSPGAKFLYIIRDPIERAISHYWYAVQRHRENEGMMAAIKNKPHYVAASDYLYQLEPYIEAFGRERIHVVTYESFFNNPEVGLRRIFEWLEIGIDYEVDNLHKKRNVGDKQLVQIKGKGTLYKLAKGRVWRRISPFVPAAVKATARSLAVKNVRRNDTDREAVEAYLRPIFLSKMNKLIDAIGQEIPEWKTVYPHSTTRA